MGTRMLALASLILMVMLAGCGSTPHSSRESSSNVIDHEFATRCETASERLLAWQELTTASSVPGLEEPAQHQRQRWRRAYRAAMAAEQAAGAIAIVRPSAQKTITIIEKITTHSRAGLFDLLHPHRPGIDAEIVGTNDLATTKYRVASETLNRLCGLS